MRGSCPVVIGVVLIALAGCGETAPPAAAKSVDHAASIAAGLEAKVQVEGRPVTKWPLADRLAYYKIPGVSIAVVDSGRIVWARGFGLKQVGGTDSVNAETLFQAASISKPVSATGMLRLVQEGKLSLDEPVNTYLRSWTFPDNRFTAKGKVTLRGLASHTAGLTVHGFPGYTVTDSLPTIPQILDGKKPANTGPVRADTFPGSLWRYSGGGTTMMGLVMMDVTGEAYPALIKRLVLDPMGMTHSTYEEPLPVDRTGNAASAHEADGSMIPGRWHVYPELPPASLWTTPTDLVKWAMEIAAARAGKSDKVLSQATVTEMLAPSKWPTGLGPFREGEGRAFQFGHGGDNAGFHADLIYFPETGQGAAIMTNGDAGQSLISEIKVALSKEYQWPGAGPMMVKAVELDSARKVGLTGTYLMNYERETFPLDIALDQGRLTAKSLVSRAPEELLPQDSTTFVGATSGFSYTFPKPNEVTVTLSGAFAMSGTRKGGKR